MKALLNRRQIAATAIGTAITALSFAAIAQGTVPAAPAQAAQPAQAAVPAPHHAQAPGHRHGHGPQSQADRQARFQKHLAEQQSRLKDSLQLRPEQESAWKDFIAQTQPKPRAMGERPSREQWAQLSTPQRLDRLEALKAERDAALKQRHDSIRRFYGQLSAPQQKAFDAQRGMGLAQMGQPGHRGHKGHVGEGHRAGPRAQRG